jgi:hypothetical protein
MAARQVDPLSILFVRRTSRHVAVPSGQTLSFEGASTRSCVSRKVFLTTGLDNMPRSELGSIPAAERRLGADFPSLRKQEVNMAHPTPFEAIAAAIESANIDFPDAGDGTTREHIYRPTEECNHLARAVIAGLEKWGYSIVPTAQPRS